MVVQDKWAKSYKFALEVINGQKQWPITGYPPLLPPPHRRMSRRPKKNRRKKADEKQGNSHGVSKKGAKMTCSKCKQVGHNKKCCINNPVEVVAILKKRRGRPRKESSGLIAPAPKRPYVSRNNNGASSSTALLRNNSKQPKQSKQPNIPHGFGIFHHNGNTYFNASCI